MNRHSEKFLDKLSGRFFGGGKFAWLKHRQAPLWLAGCGLFLGVSSLVVHSMQASPQDSTKWQQRAEAVLLAQQNRTDLQAIDSESWKRLRPDSSLSDPETMLPRVLKVNSAHSAYLLAEENCQTENLALDPELEKWRDWIMAICSKLKPQPEFFARAPFIHPLGGSWAQYIATRQPPAWREDTAWMSALKSYLHVLELPGESGPVSSSLLPEQLQTIISGKDWVLAHDYLWLKRLNGDGHLVMPRDEFRVLLGKESLQASTSSTCSGLIRFGLCFLESSPAPSTLAGLAFPMGTGGGVLLVCGFLVVLFQWRASERRLLADRQLVMQTLAHELRHPATSLQLSLEVMRDQFDSLPADSQVEFMRMIDQVQKLRRVLEASRQYLQSSENTQAGFRFEMRTIDDLSEYLSELAAPYEGKLHFTKPASPLPFQVDRYWLGLCVTNLLKNALIHGSHPIELKLERTSSGAHISVSDAGPSPALTFNEMITPLSKRSGSPGMGLGLSLVSRLMQLMGGKLTFTTSPNTFHLWLEEIK